MIKIKAPNIKWFFVVLSDDENDLIFTEEGDEAQGYVEFRQAITRDEEFRTGRLCKLGDWILKNNQYVYLGGIDPWYRVRIEVLSTLSGTDICFEDGTDLRFVDGRVADEQQFNDWWDMLPFRWAVTIHSFCLRMNPMWNPSRKR
jgi:hypothetical protein